MTQMISAKPLPVLKARVPAMPATTVVAKKADVVGSKISRCLIQTPKMRAAAEYRGIQADCDQAIAKVKQAIAQRQGELAKPSKLHIRWPVRKDALLTELNDALKNLEFAKQNAGRAVDDLFAKPKWAGKFPVLEAVKLPASMAMDINLDRARAALDRAGRLSPPRLTKPPVHKPGTPIGPPIPPFDLNPISRAISGAQAWISLAKMRSGNAKKIPLARVHPCAEPWRPRSGSRYTGFQ